MLRKLDDSQLFYIWLCLLAELGFFFLCGDFGKKGGNFWKKVGNFGKKVGNFGKKWAILGKSGRFWEKKGRQKNFPRRRRGSCRRRSCRQQKHQQTPIPGITCSRAAVIIARTIWKITLISWTHLHSLVIYSSNTAIA